MPFERVGELVAQDCGQGPTRAQLLEQGGVDEHGAARDDEGVGDLGLNDADL